MNCSPLKFYAPQTEAEYDALVSFADELTNTYNCNKQPHAAFDLVSAYIDGWERRRYPDLKDMQVSPHDMLVHYLCRTVRWTM